MSRFRVLQLNMQFGQGWDEADPDHAPIRLEATIEEIRSHGADIILLQEVERALPGGRQHEPPPHFMRLKAALEGYDACFAYPRPDPRELPFGIGLAIFSRQKLYDLGRIDLPSPPIEFEFRGRKTTPTDRVLLMARTNVGGASVQLLNTHLLAFFMLGASSLDHPGQRDRVARQLALTRGPAILGGDFNVRQHQTLRAQFERHGFRTVQERETTWRRQPYVLDHIFYNRALRCTGHQVVATPVSDHHALVADFELSPEGDDPASAA